MALQFRRYPNSQIFAFDFGCSVRAATIAMGGDWHDIGGVLSGESTEFVELQPLAAIDDPSERGWAADWISAILGRERIEVTPEAKEHLWSALTSLASAPIPRADPDRPLRSSSVECTEARSPALLPRWALWPAA